MFKELRSWKVHLIVWLLIFIMDMTSSAVKVEEVSQLKQLFIILFSYYLLKVSFFYSFFSLLIPRFFKRGKNYLYFIIAIVVYLFYMQLMGLHFTYIYSYTGAEIEIGNLLYFFLSLFTLHIIAHIAYLAQEGIIEKSRAEKLMQENYKNEAAMLRAQINPHFLFNSLNTLFNLTRKTDENAANAILEMSAILRYMTDDTRKELVTLKKELFHCNAFIELMRRRIGQEYDLKITYPEKTTELLILPLSLLPLIENAFKHADLSSNGFIHVYCKHEGDEVFFSIENKIGKPNIEEKREGSGLKNLRRRLGLRGDIVFTLHEHVEKGVYRIELTQKVND